MPKLSDLILDELEERALRRLLAAYISAEDRAEKAERERQEEERNTEYYETLTRLARETARHDGLTSFWGYRQAAASWEAFCACEGYHSPFDVAEYFQPDAHWAETWELAYTSEQEKMRNEADA